MSVHQPRLSVRGGNNYLYLEAVFARGPQEIGNTGDNSQTALFGVNYLLVLAASTKLLHLYRYEGDGQWSEVVVNDNPAFEAPLDRNARRVSLAFDQAARVVIAYEYNEIVLVTRWDNAENAYRQNVSFSGVNPSLLMEATVDYQVSGSDIVLFYQSPNDRTKIHYRIQNDRYQTEFLLYEHPTGLVLDMAYPLPYRYQLLVSDSAGDKTDEVLRSNLYPILVSDSLLVTMTGLDGTYEVSTFRVPEDIPIEVTGESVDGTYASMVMRTPVQDLGGPIAVSGESVDGGYYVVVIRTTQYGDQEVAVTGDSQGDGAYVFVVYRIKDHSDLINVTGEPLTGSYAYDL